MIQTHPALPIPVVPAAHGSGDAPPRRQLLRALIRHAHPARASSLSVSKLGARRWHIRTSGDNAATRSEIYLSPDEGSLLHTSLTHKRLDILIEGSLGESTTRNLGDCLVRAMVDDARHIIFWLGKTEAACQEALGLLESFGRHIARNKIWRVVEIRGRGDLARDLTGAFARGFERPQYRRRIL